MRERLFHHPFLYRYAKSFYIVTNASDDLDFLQDIAHDAIRTNKARVPCAVCRVPCAVRVLLTD
jgi:hypothetical protein